MKGRKLPTYYGGADKSFDASLVIRKKVKGKGRWWVLQHCCLEAYCTLTWM